MTLVTPKTAEQLRQEASQLRAAADRLEALASAMEADTALADSMEDGPTDHPDLRPRGLAVVGGLRR